jgi:hypothetical protein
MSASTLSPETPGLVVSALYLRPAPRAHALSVMLELGMFVREFEATVPDCFKAEEAGEILVLFADEEVSHRDLVRSAALDGRVVVVVLPEEVPAAPFEHSEAFAVLNDQSSLLAFREAFANAGQVARRRRTTESPFRRSTTVFGGLEFHPAEPWLASGGHLAGLSPREHGILRALVTARGAVVSKESLQRQLSGSATLASDGYLKTVILRLRRKAQLLGGDPAQLSAVRGTGYVLRP